MVSHQSFSMNVLYYDNHLLVIDKPALLPTQGPGSLEVLAEAWVVKTFHKAGRAFLRPIHRLDKVASGIVVFARTSKACTRLHAMMREHKMQKTYFALLQHAPDGEMGTLEHFVAHEAYCARVCAPTHPQAKRALLHFRVVQRAPQHCLVCIGLVTGRYHQIRVQCAAIGCPVVGDRKYGGSGGDASGRIALHHARICFSHPITQEPLRFESVSEEMFGNLHRIERSSLQELIAHDPHVECVGVR